MIYTKLTNEAMKIAYKCHDGQFDLAGTPYIFHPIHIAEQLYFEDEIAVALLHDCLEDNPIIFNQEIAKSNIIPQNIIECIQILSRDKNISYKEYINSIKYNRIAHLVKILDLRHNMDTDRFEGSNLRINESLQNRYKLAMKELGSSVESRYSTIYNLDNHKIYNIRILNTLINQTKDNTVCIEAYPYVIFMQNKNKVFTSYHDTVLFDLYVSVGIHPSIGNKNALRKCQHYIITANRSDKSKRVTKTFNLANRNIRITMVIDLDAICLSEVQLRENI